MTSTYSSVSLLLFDTTWNKISKANEKKRSCWGTDVCVFTTVSKEKEAEIQKQKKKELSEINYLLSNYLKLLM